MIALEALAELGKLGEVLDPARLPFEPPPVAARVVPLDLVAGRGRPPEKVGRKTERAPLGPGKRDIVPPAPKASQGTEASVNHIE